jgi:hypothetical protein
MLRDLVAALVALILLLVAAALAGALHIYRRRRKLARLAAESQGRAVIAELPTGPDLTLVAEDARAFHYGSAAIEKARITAVRLLINGAAIASHDTPRSTTRDSPAPTIPAGPEEGIPRDRWDVAVYLGEDVVLIECGAVRERVSQELARRIYERVKAAIERPG